MRPDPKRSPRRRRPRGDDTPIFWALPFWPTIAVAAVLYAGLAVAAATVAQRGEVHDPRLADLLRRGPASYFHHFFDPQGLLGQNGDIDGNLDMLQRATTHQVVVGALARVPGGDPLFTTALAQRWGVGGKTDNGLLIFVFPEQRKVRADVGYGLEDLLPDATMRRLLDENALPAFQRADYHAGLQAVMHRIEEILRQRAGPRADFADPGPLDILERVVADIPSFSRQQRSAWLQASLSGRLKMDVLLVALLVAAVVAVVYLFVLLGALARVSAFAVRLGSWQEALTAVGAVWLLIRYLAGAAVIVLACAIGASYFFGGAGHFGGGGVELQW